VKASVFGWFIGASLLLVGSANAQSNNPLSRKSLAGVGAFGVVVEEVSADLQASGLSRSLITSEVEVRLRRQGLRVLDEEGLSREPGGPYLHVIVTGRKSAVPEIMAFVISLQFEQAVLPSRYMEAAGDNPPRRESFSDTDKWVQALNEWGKARSNQREKTVFAATWGVNAVGSVGTEGVARGIRDGLAEFVDQFIAAYFAVNPPR
jgi:hypothetical protein